MRNVYSDRVHTKILVASGYCLWLWFGTRAQQRGQEAYVVVNGGEEERDGDGSHRDLTGVHREASDCAVARAQVVACARAPQIVQMTAREHSALRNNEAISYPAIRRSLVGGAGSG